MLGFPHPDYLTPWLSASQYEDWLAWMRRFQPFPNRDDPHWGMHLAMLHNQWCGEGEAKRPLDFMPYHDRFEDDLDADEMRRRLGLKG